jgi:hypothetical protein
LSAPRMAPLWFRNSVARVLMIGLGQVDCGVLIAGVAADSAGA